MKYRAAHARCVERLGRNPTPMEFGAEAGIVYGTAVPVMIEFDLPKSRQKGSGGSFVTKDHTGAYIALCDTLGRKPTQGEFALAIGVTRQRASMLRGKFEFTAAAEVCRDGMCRTVKSAADQLRNEGRVITICRLAEKMGAKPEAARFRARLAGIEYRRSSRPESLDAATKLHGEMTAELGRFPTQAEFLRKWVKPGLRVEGRPDANRFKRILGLQFSDGRKVR